MLQAGKNITQKDDPLLKVQLEYLYHAVAKPKPEIANRINQLRNVITVNPERYKELKRKLPYIVCGIFNPPIRRTVNFAWIKYFILDIDHLSEKNLDAGKLIEKLKTDTRVHLMFRSPGNDGLKIIFELIEKCFDSQKYSLFYRVFSESFSRQYQLEQVIDKCTSDVTRACFISSDQNTYYNKDADYIDMQAFINFENHEEVSQAEMLLKEDEKAAKQSNEVEPPENKKQIPDVSFDKIKQLLNPKIRTRAQKNIYVPEELHSILNKVEKHLEKYELKLAAVNDIHYGKQLKIESGQKWAEINLFYGRKGFSIVKTAKSQSSAELCDIAHKVLCEIFIPQE
ncbi:MAG: CRISPR-associated primase-polymerase type B [Bacteroidota bacterium]|nr:CRISPR-associated primase-polymerase type B [Bacteroidota bacterium]